MRHKMRVLLLLTVLSVATAQDGKLPAPRKDGGKPLMQSLSLRRTVRDFSSRDISRQVLSDLLWAAFGVNRPDGGRTAPSAWNQQEIDLYVFTSSGVFVYEAAPHSLRLVSLGDRRGWTGPEAFILSAPVSLVFVADLARAGKSEAKDRLVYAYADAGYISQNVYLFCASEGLGTVVHDAADKAALAAKLSLRPDQRIVLSQAIGYPK
jgi:nitroreductase